MPGNRPTFAKGDGLLLIDVQRDFCLGGALAIPGGDAVVAVLNRCIEAARQTRIPVYASRDWHPLGHVSFKERGGPWPPHCPSFNPIERVWLDLHAEVTRNHRCGTIEALMAEVDYYLKHRNRERSRGPGRAVA